MSETSVGSTGAGAGAGNVGGAGSSGGAAPGSWPEAKPTITFEEFAKVDLRVARIVKAEAHSNADKLLKLELDDGSGTPRQICAGIKGHYQPEGLVGRQIVIVANLAPRVIRGEESRGMLLAASDAPKTNDPGAQRNVILLRPDTEIGVGAIVS
ncbi:MAG: methionine--tRNA ligase subunit beta [Phycisphaerales bacterium]